MRIPFAADGAKLISAARGRVVWPLLALVCIGRTAAAQRRPAAPRARVPVGLLIGFVRDASDDARQSDSVQSSGSKREAANTMSRDDTLRNGSVLHHIATTVQADRLATLWVGVDSRQARSRLVQHIIVPRPNGFWQLGSNTDSAALIVPNADSGFSERDETDDFFWVAPLGQVPRLPTLGPEDVACVNGGVTRTLTYVGPRYVGYSTFRQSACAHYDESSAMAVESLDAMQAPRGGTSVASLATVSLLGRESAAWLANLNHRAAHWRNDCGENGFAAGETDWTLRRAPAHWEAVALFTGIGAGTCGRYSVERVISRTVPPPIATPATPLPVAWSRIKASMPAAIDATASPDGHVVVVLEPHAVTIFGVERGKLRALGGPIPWGGGQVVMLEWARGERAARWDEVLSTLPVLERAP